MSQSLSEFTNQYSLSKTLRFELRPVGKTKELFEQSPDTENPLRKIIKEDEKRAEEYKKAKDLINDIHRDFLNIAFAEENIPEDFKKNFEKLSKEAYSAWKEKKQDKGKKATRSTKKISQKIN